MAEPLKFGNQSFEPNTRMLYDMKSVIYDTKWLSTAKNTMLYYFYRGVFLNEQDKKAMEEHKIRYDTTFIPPGKIGKEFVKTQGHYHPIVPGTNVTYPEVYQVQSGKALYLLQKEENGKITDVIVVNASAGDIVVIPPNYGHITINASEEMLSMSNWVSSRFSSIYKPIEKKKGGAYYKLTDGRFVQNQNYGTLPKPRFVKMDYRKRFGVKGDMYELIKTPEKLMFLNEPQKHKDVFELTK